MSLVYLAACGCLIGLILRLPSSHEPRMPLLAMIGIGAGGALMGSFLVGAAGELSVMEIDLLVVLGAVTGALLVLAASHGYYRLCVNRVERAHAISLIELSRPTLEAVPIRTTQPPPAL
ncbi:MAG: hypothetical protein QM778_06500 [Myxococcales bacterium]